MPLSSFPTDWKSERVLFRPVSGKTDEELETVVRQVIDVFDATGIKKNATILQNSGVKSGGLAVSGGF